MINLKILKKIEEIFNPDFFIVYGIYDAKDSYLFCIKNKENINEEPLDPWYSIDKKTYKINGFLPHDHKEIFKYALSHKLMDSK